MKNSPRKIKKTDLEECKDKVRALLEEYNCELLSSDGWHSVLIRDLDTAEAQGLTYDKAGNEVYR